MFHYPSYSYFTVASFHGLPQYGIGHMTTLLKRLWKENAGQDLIEYALLAATLAVVVAGFLPPALMPSVSTIFSKITSTLGLS